MRELLLQVLREVRPDIDFEGATTLIDDQILDSFDIIQVVMGINETFDVEISVDDMQPVNFNSVEAMLKLIGRLQAE